jgi:hypothetical protein
MKVEVTAAYRLEGDSKPLNMGFIDSTEHELELLESEPIDSIEEVSQAYTRRVEEGNMD